MLFNTLSAAQQIHRRAKVEPIGYYVVAGNRLDIGIIAIFDKLQCDMGINKKAVGGRCCNSWLVYLIKIRQLLAVRPSFKRDWN